LDNEINHNLLEDDFPQKITKTYNEIRRRFSLLHIDSLKVVQDVIKHRNYWKPDKVKTTLLAESHVYTPDNENTIKIEYPEDEIFNDLPSNFVRLVYCLGYGENHLVTNIIKNKGTPQYWKIFSACASDSENFEFYKVSKTETPNDIYRLKNKVSLLRKLRSKGVWLVDCSIVGLYNFGKTIGPNVLSEVLEYCWDNYIKSIIKKENPGHIVIIGKGVGGAISRKLRIIGVDYTVLPQPQARLSSEEHQEALRQYQGICNR